MLCLFLPAPSHNGSTQDSYFGYYSLSINLKSNIHILADIPHRWEEENEKCAVASLHQRYSLNFSLFFRKRVKIHIYMHRHTSTYFQKLPVLKLNKNSPRALPYLQMQAPLTLSQSFCLFREWHLIESIT